MLFTSEQQAVPNLQKLGAKWLPGLLLQQTKKFHKFNKEDVLENTKEATKFSLAVFTSKAY